MPHPRNRHIRNGKLATALIWASLHPQNPLSKILFFLSGCDIGRELPLTTYLPHPQGIVIGSNVKIGNNVIIGHQVTLGGKDLEIENMPEIEHGVYIGAGAKILGKTRVGVGATVGANAVITKDIPAGAVVVGANQILGGKKSVYALKTSDHLGAL